MKDKNSEIVLGTRCAPIRVEMCPPHGVYELISTLFLLYCGSYYNALNLFDIHIQKVSSLKQLYLNNCGQRKVFTGRIRKLPF